MMDLPSFIDSPFFVMEDENWHLLDGAPEELVKEFEEYMRQMRHETYVEEDGE